MSVVDRSIEQWVEEELAKMDPAALQYLEQLLAENTPAGREQDPSET
jgi:succinate dehydrogenase flavin-adding protein (antitoxin of CptAB toxin-antitoxin module)